MRGIGYGPADDAGLADGPGAHRAGWGETGRGRRGPAGTAGPALTQPNPRRAARLATSVVQVADAPFLPGSEGAWVEMVRLRLQRRRTTALGLLTEAALLAGDQSLAVANAETALAADPLDETFHRLLMHAHAASGNRAQALLAYARCRELLADELGTDPSPK